MIPLCLCAAMLAFTGSARAQEPIYVSGSVVSKATGKPVAGATISAYAPGGTDPAAVTQALGNGAFVLQVLQPGTYHLVTTAGNRYFAEAQRVQVPPGGVPSLVIACDSLTLCDRCRPLIRLSLTGADGAPEQASPLGIRVQMDVPGLQPVQFQENQAPGRRGVAFVRVPAAALRQLLVAHQTLDQVDDVAIEARSPRDGYGLTHLSAWPEGPVHMTLSPGVTLRGMVVKDGVPAARAVAVLMPPQDWTGLLPPQRLTTARDGALSFSDLPPGNYQVRIRLQDGTRFMQRVALSSSQTGLVFSPG